MAVQVGAIAAVLVYFRRDTAALAAAWFRGLAGREARKRREHRMAWYVIAGSVPIGIVGFAAKGLISGPLRNVWVVVVALFLWSVVMVLAERLGSQGRAQTDLWLRDTMVVGVIQCLALAPGVSRSAATMSAGLFRGLDRTAATRVSFFLSIPATGSGRSLWGGHRRVRHLRQRGLGGHRGGDRGEFRRGLRIDRLAAPSRRLTASPSSSVTACCWRPQSPSAWELAS